VTPAVVSSGAVAAQPSPRRFADRTAFRITAYYGGAAFIFLQTADALIPALGLPDAAGRAVAYAFIGGFPVAVIIGSVLDLIAARRADAGGAPASEGHDASGIAIDAPTPPAAGADPVAEVEPEVVSATSTPHGGHTGPAIVVGLALTTVAVAVTLAALGWSRLGVETYLALWATVAGGVWFLFDKAEQSVNETVRAETAAWLEADSARIAMDGLPRVFQVMFDKVFGERHLSWTCFYRSCFASLLAVTAVLAAWLVTRPEARMLAGEPAFIRSVLWMVFFTGLLNFIPDYLSLLETRLLLTRMTGRWKTRTILLADALFTGVISFAVIRLSLALVYASGMVMVPVDGGDEAVLTMQVRQQVVDLGSPRDQIIDMVTFSEDFGGISMSIAAEGNDTYGEVPIPIGMFFWSAFVTSAWLWLFAAATVVLRVLATVGARFRPLVAALGASEAPFRAVGYASVMVVTVLFMIGLPAVLL